VVFVLAGPTARPAIARGNAPGTTTRVQRLLRALKGRPYRAFCFDEAYQSRGVAGGAGVAPGYRRLGLWPSTFRRSPDETAAVILYSPRIRSEMCASCTSCVTSCDW